MNKIINYITNKKQLFCRLKWTDSKQNSIRHYIKTDNIKADEGARCYYCCVNTYKMFMDNDKNKFRFCGLDFLVWLETSAVDWQITDSSQRMRLWDCWQGDCYAKIKQQRTNSFSIWWYCDDEAWSRSKCDPLHYTAHTHTHTSHSHQLVWDW